MYAHVPQLFFLIQQAKLSEVQAEIHSLENRLARANQGMQSHSEYCALRQSLCALIKYQGSCMKGGDPQLCFIIEGLRSLIYSPAFCCLQYRKMGRSRKLLLQRHEHTYLVTFRMKKQCLVPCLTNCMVKTLVQDCCSASQILSVSDITHSCDETFRPSLLFCTASNGNLVGGAWEYNKTC